MSLKKTRSVSHGKRQAKKNKLVHERLSSQNSAMVRGAEARLNLLRTMSELKAQLGIDNEWQL